MIPLVGKVARFWKTVRGDSAHAFHDVIEFDKSLSREAAKELYRG
jgi:hypothetical protein